MGTVGEKIDIVNISNSEWCSYKNVLELVEYRKDLVVENKICYRKNKSL